MVVFEQSNAEFTSFFWQLLEGSLLYIFIWGSIPKGPWTLDKFSFEFVLDYELR